MNNYTTLFEKFRQYCEKLDKLHPDRNWLEILDFAKSNVDRLWFYQDGAIGNILESTPPDTEHITGIENDLSNLLRCVAACEIPKTLGYPMLLFWYSEHRMLSVANQPNIARGFVSAIDYAWAHRRAMKSSRIADGLEKYADRTRFRITDWLRANGSGKPYEIAYGIRSQSDTVRQTLRRMLAEKLVTRHPDGRYSLVKA